MAESRKRAQPAAEPAQAGLPPGVYTAIVPLYVGGIRAHNPGDRVPVDNIIRNGWQEKVARVD